MIQNFHCIVQFFRRDQRKTYFFYWLIYYWCFSGAALWRSLHHLWSAHSQCLPAQVPRAGQSHRTGLTEQWRKMNIKSFTDGSVLLSLEHWQWRCCVFRTKYRSCRSDQSLRSSRSSSICCFRRLSTGNQPTAALETSCSRCIPSTDR